MSKTGIQMPSGVMAEDVTPTFTRFVIQPLERGYGQTIGNSLRRVLLSSLEGTVITAVKIDGVQHEFSTIEGVAEDVSDIILNLKGIRFKSSDFSSGAVSLQVKGPGHWTAQDIDDATNDYEVLNPEHHIATLSEGVEFGVEMRIETGRRYVPANENKRDSDHIGVIALDSVYTPIKSVRVTVKPTRVGQRVDYERLELEVSTDGSIIPQNALKEAASILNDHIDPIIDMELVQASSEVEEPVDADQIRLIEKVSQSVDTLELSVRAKNCLKAANIKTIRDLVVRDEQTMLKFRNFGSKSLDELKQVLDSSGLSFGMDLPEIDGDDSDS
ncbi:MAG: DNA-directed RNA polymerase subunit alpha [Bacteroidetes bacterium]|nr:DNA-directed RNA polymerase subunit alpha [Bacteroidota bacterium]